MTDSQGTIVLKCSPEQEVKGSVLCFHGMSADPRELLGLAKHLQASGFNSLIPCLRGHESVDVIESIENLGKVKARDWLNDTETIYQELQKLPKPHFILGLSFGSLLALWISAKHADKIKGTIVLSLPFKFKNKLKERLITLLSFLPDFILDRLGTVKKPNLASDRLLLPRNTFSKHSLGAAARFIQVRKRVFTELSKINSPILLLQDPRDHLMDTQGLGLLTDSVSSTIIDIEIVEGGEHELTQGHLYERVFEIVTTWITNAA